MNPQTIILASTSIYRRELLERLKIPFDIAAPNIDEMPLPGEPAVQTSRRLAQEKARIVAADHPDALVIGSDQVALLDGRQMGKPLTDENAVRQLQAMRGQTVSFYTALALLNSRSRALQIDVNETRVTFRNYSDVEIDSYLQKEQPYHCAGSAKSEGLGIALISSIEGNDPNALIGLPLISLITMLKNEGVRIP